MRPLTFLSSCLLTAAGYAAFFAALAYTPQFELRAQGSEEAPFLRTKNSDIGKLPALVAYYEFDGKATNLAQSEGYPLDVKAPYSISGGRLHANGNVLLGSVQRLGFFDHALSAEEAQTVLRKSTAHLGKIPNIVQGSDHLPTEMRHEVDEQWTPLPPCIAGVKAKTVKVFCPDGAEMQFLISSDEEETMFFVLENAFSPALEDSENRQFNSCLQHLLTVARGRCSK